MPPDRGWDQPLLITGCPRTGSTVLTRSLSTHREFCLFNEYQLYDDYPDMEQYRSDQFMSTLTISHSASHEVLGRYHPGSLPE
jgi:hypothetical protein